MKQELPVVQKAYDLAKEVLPRVSRFPRDYKYTLGDRIAENTLEILENVIQAAFRKERKPVLENINLSLERLRFLLRLPAISVPYLGTVMSTSRKSSMIWASKLELAQTFKSAPCPRPLKTSILKSPALLT